MPRGRPKNADSRSCSLHVRLTPEQYEFLGKYAYERHMTMSEYMRKMVEKLMIIQQFEGFKEVGNDNS